MRWRALWTGVWLSVLFLIGYGATNWFTSTRTDTWVWMYEWERYIPFVPLMIVPYMSIDVFFVIAPFLCADRHELRTLASRIVLAVGVACAVFLLMPLRLGVERPPASGWLGAFFDWFRAMDQPHNLFPSLHITLRSILAELYFRHTRGMWRWILVVWFSLIGLSTLLTYQHHVIDIVGGFALAAVCFYVVPNVRSRTRSSAHMRLGMYYLIGAVMVAILAATTWRYEGWILYWPAASLAVVSVAYFGIGPSVYRKHNGRIEFAARMLLGPVLIGQWLSRCYYGTRSAAWNVADDRVWIGRQLNQAEARDARLKGVIAVLDLTTEFSEPRVFRSLDYLNVQVLDLTAPSPDQIAQGVEFIRRRCADGTVYVHCKAGYSRSAVIVGAYLMTNDRTLDADEVAGMLKSVRPGMVIRREARQALREFEDSIAKQRAGPNDLRPTMADDAEV